MSDLSFRYSSVRAEHVVTVLLHSQLRRDLRSRSSELTSEVQRVLEFSADLLGVEPRVATLNVHSVRPSVLDVDVSGSVADPEASRRVQGAFAVVKVRDAEIPARLFAVPLDDDQLESSGKVVQLFDGAGDIFGQLDSNGGSCVLDANGAWVDPMTPELFWTHAEFLRLFH